MSESETEVNKRGIVDCMRGVSSKYKRITIYYKQKYIIKMTAKSVHSSLWPAQNKTFVDSHR